MSFFIISFLNRTLSRKTSIFGLRIWVVIAIATGAAILLFLFLLPLFCRRRHRRRHRHRHLKPQNPMEPNNKIPTFKDPPPQIPKSTPETRPIDTVQPPAETRIEIERKKESPSGGGAQHHQGGGGGGGPPEVSHLGWGRWYTLRELEVATGGMAEENVIGEGGYGIVYYGVLEDKTMVAVKNLLNNRGQAEQEFKVEVEAIGRVMHKNLVRLLGYCVEGEYRMLVYEYVDNGNLDQWLHGDVGEVSPLTWEIRMKIILGTAKGLTYLHEGLEPKVVHRDVKSSNILLDRQWNPKVSDFGLAKLLCSERTYVTTRVMGTFGYVAPEYACSGMLNERSDVYSFGVLIMEIITGRVPVDYARPHGEVHLVEWLKAMVGERKAEQVVDPKMPVKPSSKALKRALLVALRCIDPDSHKRPKMGHVIHMLEVEDLFCDDHKSGQEASTSQRTYSNYKQLANRYDSNNTSDEEESYQKPDIHRHGNDDPNS